MMVANRRYIATAAAATENDGLATILSRSWLYCCCCCWWLVLQLLSVCYIKCSDQPTTGHVPPMYAYPESLAFAAQISYSHEKQFRVIPIIVFSCAPPFLLLPFLPACLPSPCVAPSSLYMRKYIVNLSRPDSILCRGMSSVEDTPDTVKQQRFVEPPPATTFNLRWDQGIQSVSQSESDV